MRACALFTYTNHKEHKQYKLQTLLQNYYTRADTSVSGPMCVDRNFKFIATVSEAEYYVRIFSSSGIGPTPFPL